MAMQLGGIYFHYLPDKKHNLGDIILVDKAYAKWLRIYNPFW
ncbi:MAG: hypothetical protein ACTJID_08465 [Proteus vulgaris]